MEKTKKSIQQGNYSSIEQNVQSKKLLEITSKSMLV